MQSGTRRHVDYIASARLIRQLRAGNPGRWENLQCIRCICHKLCMAGELEYLAILRTLHF